MPLTKKILFFKQVAIFLTLVWTLMTYSFFVYQMNNERFHLEKRAISNAKNSSFEAESLINWAFESKLRAIEENKDFNINIGFSLRDLIYNMAKKQAFDVKIDGFYEKDDFKLLENKKFKDTIKEAQNSKYDSYSIYEQNGKEFIFYVKPLLAKESCLKCHIHDDKKVGDVLGHISVKIGVPTLKEDNPSTYNFLVFIYSFIWFIGIILIWWIKYKSSQYFEEKAKHYEESIYSFVDMIERRDRYIAGHSQRVAKYASLIAKEMKLNDYDIDLIFRAGMLHDIGKIEIPDALLLKPDKLNDEEFEIIKSHPRVGYELLYREPFYELASIVLHHHENFDGSGYPCGLKGYEIPLLSQIISIADVFDALTTNRAYRKALSKEDSIEYIVKMSGVKFNPKIVSCAKKVFEEYKIEDNNPMLQSCDINDLRFSCYFRDQLTGYFNVNYLKFLLARNDEYELACMYYINFVNFTSFNAKFGWNNGDKLLQNFSRDVVLAHENTILVRLFADNFLLLSLKKEFKLNKIFIKEFENEFEVKIEAKKIDIKHYDCDTYNELENLILSS